MILINLQKFRIANLFLLVITGLSLTKVEGQTRELDKEVIAEVTTYFSIEDKKYHNANELLQEVHDARFVALGEIHGSKRLGNFTEALLIECNKTGFNTLALEVGPYSAEKLETLISEGSDVVSDFYSDYSSKPLGIYPIPFFINKSDLEFLAAADSLNYDLWGIDQEFAFSTVYLLDELISLTSPLSKEQTDLYRKVRKKLKWWYKREKITPDFNLSCNTKDYKPFQSLLNSFDASNKKISQIVDALQESLDIYCLAENGKWKDSNIRRVTYFYNNFASNLQNTGKNSNDPKVILKMGSYHMGRNTSPLNIYDIGNYVQKISSEKGEKTVHIRFLYRFLKNGEDKMNDKNWSAFQNFISVGRVNEWALIDLKALRMDLEAGLISANELEKREILNYDFLIIMPADERNDKHY